MADKAHAKTDEKLEEMEKRPSAIYSRAEKTVQKRWLIMQHPLIKSRLNCCRPTRMQKQRAKSGKPKRHISAFIDKWHEVKGNKVL